MDISRSPINGGASNGKSVLRYFARCAGRLTVLRKSARVASFGEFWGRVYAFEEDEQFKRSKGKCL